MTEDQIEQSTLEYRPYHYSDIALSADVGTLLGEGVSSTERAG